MATKYNNPNAKYEEIKKNKDGDYQQQKLYNDIQELMMGGWVYCDKWSQVEDILEVFDDNEDFEIEEVEEIFFVQGKCGKAQKRKFKEALKGNLEEAEKEKKDGKER